MPFCSGVSVALPVFRAEPALLSRAVDCVRAQTLGDLDILIILNGADRATARVAEELAGRDPRIRLMSLESANLAGALNAALRAARFDLVARMDADDQCPPDRLARQTAFLGENPGVAAVGTAAEVCDESGTVSVSRPPCDPAEVRWRLHLGNVLCHGSVVLRRAAVLAAGGYNESYRYAQDYDLWLRLARRHEIANLPEVLYRYSARTRERHHEQARTAGQILVEAWSALPAPSQDASREIGLALAGSTWGGRGALESLKRIESLLGERGPTREALLAWHVVAQRAGLLGNERCERVRDAGRRLRAAGVGSVCLYGAGRHTAWLLENPEELGVPIAGIADDALAGTRQFGFAVARPGELPPDTEVLLSSDAHEDRLWQAAASLRARGLRVWRVYGAAGAAS